MHTSTLEEILNRLDGSPEVFNELIIYSKDRLLVMTHALMSHEKMLHRWKETDDVFQNVMIRFDRVLRQVQPHTKKAFLTLAATLIRREIIDLCRSLCSQKSFEKNHHTTVHPNGSDFPHAYEESGFDSGISLLELHEEIDTLPDDESKELINLIFYQGMNCEEVGKVLNISPRTVKRRWQSVRLGLMERLENK